MDDYSDYDWTEFDNATDDYMASRSDDSWFWDSIGIDPSTISTSDTSPSNAEILKEIGYQDPGIASTLTNFLSKAGSGALNFLKNQYTKDGKVDWRAVAATAGGLYGAYKSQQAQPKTGYQGKIPKYEAVREAVAGSQYDPDRRPGSGGQRYFSDLTYAAPGEAATTARAAAKTQAEGLAALNRENPAKEAPTPTRAAAEKGAESDKARAKTFAEGGQTGGGLPGMYGAQTRSPYEEEEDKPYAKPLAYGGITTLAQGRYLGGATDGMADKIPARIDGKQEARLSHGEFVIPADVVGHLGNGNSEAGAKRLYEMMDRIRKARTGNSKQGKQINPNKFLPS